MKRFWRAVRRGAPYIVLLVGLRVAVAGEVVIDLPGLPGEAVPLALVEIQAGTRTIGNPEPRRGMFDWPLREEFVPDYWIGKYEITQAQYRAVMGYNPSERFGGSNRVIIADDRPVFLLYWLEAVEFCERLSERVPGWTFRLPSEIEWEAACRAGSETTYEWGDQEWFVGPFRHISLPIAGFHAWYWWNIGWRMDRKNGPMPVGRLMPNRWGIHDMSGNVWEWCGDRWNHEGHEEGTKTAKKDENIFAVRGGSCWSYVEELRASNRQPAAGWAPTLEIGFRVRASGE